MSNKEKEYPLPLYDQIYWLSGNLKRITKELSEIGDKQKRKELKCEVCHWYKNDYNVKGELIDYKTACEYHVLNDDQQIFLFKYCPYCGRSIVR